MGEGNLSLEGLALGLSESLARSRSAYSALLELEREQERLIRAEDFEGAADKIAEKQSMLDEVQSADHRLHFHLEQWQPVKDQAPEMLRERLQAQVESLQGVMSEILQVQKTNEEGLRKYGDEISAKLRDLHKNKSAQRGYQQRTANDAYQRSKFYDQSS